jgi:hypothetical protein
MKGAKLDRDLGVYEQKGSYEASSPRPLLFEKATLVEKACLVDQVDRIWRIIGDSKGKVTHARTNAHKRS